MKISQMLFATTFTIAAASSFAAKSAPVVTVSDQEDAVIVSTQESPETATAPTTEQPTSEVSVESDQPAQPAQ